MYICKRDLVILFVTNMLALVILTIAAIKSSP